MSRRSRQRRQRHDTQRLDAVQPPSAAVFADMLEHNEEIMPEHAGMAATCDLFGISEDEGYDLLISLSESV